MLFRSDIITKLVDMGDLRRAKRAANKLAAFYQNSLADGSEVLSLAKEIQLIENYMAIQNIRYGDAFHLNLHIDSQLSALLIPKLTLQPLVENAIYHGLKLVDRPGEIGIMATEDDEKYMIHLWDNGLGLTEDRIIRINDELHLTLAQREAAYLNEDDIAIGFGLSSVAERLKLYYGPGTRLAVESRTPNEGLQITIHIPKEAL